MAGSNKPAPSAPAVIAAQEVRVGPHTHRIAVPGAGNSTPAAPTASAPSVEPIRNGDVIIGVEVTCTCGQKIRIAFDTGGK
jgi:hypothetical protein